MGKVSKMPNVPKVPFCKRVIFWGQYGPTCWFNALLMSVLYSQYSRNVLYQKSKTWDLKIELFRLLRYVLKYKYLKTKNPENDYAFFNAMNPEVILEMLYKVKPKYLPSSFKHGYISSLFVSKLYKILGVDCLMLNKIDNDIFYDLYNHLDRSPNILSNEKYVRVKHKPKSEAYIKNKLKELRTPSVLIVNDNNAQNTEEHVRNLNLFVKYRPIPYYKIDLDSSNKDILSLKDNIMYNGEEYILDSIILSNWNASNNIPGHTIAGITCGNDRYVYNGWTRYTADPALIYGNLNTKHKGNNLMKQKIPCELFKYHWKQSEGSDFCISTSACRLDKANKRDFKKHVCFSFSKGSRSLIYVKKRSTINLDHLNLSHTPNYRSFNDPISSTTGKMKTPVQVKIGKPARVAKECPEGKVRNPLTGRCIKIESAQKKKLVRPDIKASKPVKKELKECPEGKVRNPLTGRCIKIQSAAKKNIVRSKVKPSNHVKKECPEGKVRNPLTGRCIKRTNLIRKNAKHSRR